MLLVYNAGQVRNEELVLLIGRVEVLSTGSGGVHRETISACIFVSQFLDVSEIMQKAARMPEACYVIVVAPNSRHARDGACAVQGGCRLMSLS